MIQLEKGKVYEVRNPDEARRKNHPPVVKIEHDYGDIVKGNDGCCYFKDGIISYSWGNDPFDLVKEVTA